MKGAVVAFRKIVFSIKSRSSATYPRKELNCGSRRTQGQLSMRTNHIRKLPLRYEPHFKPANTGAKWYLIRQISDVLKYDRYGSGRPRESPRTWIFSWLGSLWVIKGDWQSHREAQQSNAQVFVGGSVKPFVVPRSVRHTIHLLVGQQPQPSQDIQVVKKYRPQRHKGMVGIPANKNRTAGLWGGSLGGIFFNPVSPLNALFSLP